MPAFPSNHYKVLDGLVKAAVLFNAYRGARASAIIYSITETARANNLNVYYYIKHLLTELPQLVDENGNIEQSMLEPLMPWSKTLPADCYSKRRN